MKNIFVAMRFVSPPGNVTVARNTSASAPLPSNVDERAQLIRVLGEIASRLENAVDSSRSAGFPALRPRRIRATARPNAKTPTAPMDTATARSVSSPAAPSDAWRCA